MVQFSRPPLIKNSNIYVVSDDNQTFSLGLENGDLIWSHSGNLEEVSIIGGSKPVIHNNILIVSYSSGEIYALNASYGTLLWFDNITSGNFLRTFLENVLYLFKLFSFWEGYNGFLVSIFIFLFTERSFKARFTILSSIE